HSIKVYFEIKFYREYTQMVDDKLLEEIAMLLQTPVLSDLHAIHGDNLRKTIEKIGIENYSLGQWRYALSYILGVEIQLEKVEDIEIALQKFQ
ncbi:MAG: hypothetical protein RR131_09215, partial [Anaerovorax sp.]